jgi:hypothetical protein
MCWKQGKILNLAGSETQIFFKNLIFLDFWDPMLSENPRKNKYAKLKIKTSIIKKKKMFSKFFVKRPGGLNFYPSFV